MTVGDKELIQVQNLTDHSVGFVDEDTRRRIVFHGREIKKLPAEILRRLNFSHGGSVLLTEYLSVKNEELAREFGVQDDTIEYNWGVEDVDKLLATGSEDALKDALDFAPEVIKELIVERAVVTKLNNISKREIIFEMTGQDVTSKIRNKEEYEKAMDLPVEQAAPAKRRVSAAESSATKGRRVQQEQEK